MRYATNFFDRVIVLTVMFPLPVHTIQIIYLYLAIFQQNLYIEYTFLSWSDIPELVVPVVISLIEVCW
jgi:hypothetical protein